ncbi:hypothetical protein [Knoellia aerolata]|uniref:Uncharacterized protein n=1 Tax=Knoellia aerolata DSM 18566 TaxID=1385519 RepID=A0A0A0K0U3_9MICO|nr:hypothetical protein [Knoellia aerolata]KGN43028.1 hypothetical protein N801_05465 [Knoellia aerolata DSM 18566]
MTRITKTTALAGMAGAAAIVTLGVGANAALAETTPTPAPSSSSATSDSDDAPSTSDAMGERRGGHGPGGKGGMRGADASALAEQLGLDEATVEAAVTKVREATRPTERPAEGTRPTEAEREARQAAYVTALAEELGVTEAKLTAALAEIRGEHQAEHRTRLEERLDTAVDDGTLSDADRASVLKAFDAGVLGGGGPR